MSTTPPVVLLALAAEHTDPDARTITGTATHYDTPAPSMPPSVFAAGAIWWADDPARVKLLIDHDDAQPVGYATEVTDHGDRVETTFYVPETPEGDRALRDARLGLRDGLSVRVVADEDGYSLSDDGYLTITSGQLREVSLCAIPAQDGARVSDVAATTTREVPMTETTTTDNGRPPEATPAAPEAPATVAATTAPADPPAPQAPPVLPATGRTVTARQAAGIVHEVMSTGGTAADVRAALKDVTPSNLPSTESADMEDPFLRNSFLGQLWQASQTARPVIDLLGAPKPITGRKIYGWRWATRPTVADYSGNKSAIPSNQPKIEEVEATVKRTAGGWDVDRIYTDLGDPSLIEALWEAAVEDYKRQTEAKALAELVAAGTGAGDSDDVPAALVAIGATAAGLGANVSGVALASDLWAALAGMTKNEVPWWLGSGDSMNFGTTTGEVGQTRVFVEPSLAAGSYLALDSRAATYYEQQPPVRVNAVDLPRGGVDLGLFGYHGLIVNDERAIITGTVGAGSGGSGGSGA